MEVVLDANPVVSVKKLVMDQTKWNIFVSYISIVYFTYHHSNQSLRGHALITPSLHPMFCGRWFAPL